MKTKLLLLLFLAHFFIHAQYTLIPDANFENKLISLGIDSGVPDGKVLTANAAAVTNLKISKSSISDLTGIEDFTALTSLSCTNNSLTSLDLSNNKNLKSLYCDQNKLTSLDLANNVNLTTVECSYNKLQNLNISTNLALKNLYCINNQLANIDVTHNIALEQFYCFGNQLTALDVTKNLNLLGLECGLNKLTSLDVSKNTLMYYLECYSNQLTTLDVTKNTALFHLNFFSNQLTSIDLSNNTVLKELYCLNNQLTSLDVSKNTALTNLDCKNNKLSTLNLKNGNNTLLSTDDLNFTNNASLTCIQVDDVSYSDTNWANMKDASASYNIDCSSLVVDIPDQSFEQKLIDLGIDTDGLNGKISGIDIEKITSLDLSNSNITDLTGIEFFTGLTYLNCYNNQITSLDLSKNILLEILNAASNQLTTLDLSNNPNLNIVYVILNQLKSLNLQNGNNQNFVLPSENSKKSGAGLFTSFLQNTELTCIKVDNATYSNANWSKIKEAATVYSETCTLGLEDSVFSKTAIYPNPTKGEVNIKNASLEKANVYNVLGQLVKSFTLNSSNTDNTINLSGLPKGVYYVYLINQDSASAKKVIVE